MFAGRCLYRSLYQLVGYDLRTDRLFRAKKSGPYSEEYGPELRFRLVELLRHYSKPVHQGSRLRRLVEMMEQSTNRQVREPVEPPAPHRLDRRLTAAVVSELIAAYQAGETTGVLRQRYGLSQGSVLKLLREQGVVMRRQGLSETDKAVVAELYRGRATLAQLGTRFGVSPNVVRRALLAAGVTMRARGGGKPWGR
ncbi:hypothetical protein FZI85_28350 [Mycobacterium sp. CBMA293]|uniref:hypothetical protein n=1 Tax=unclassified Mycolicibacterium TaxID=2636767 RepID=UPI0012DCA106|nr:MULTISPECIES: hypothetical protein [unclassified Mycolicibacterium]MUL45658.1 hypothetical protein [Mycolicibacterium sp. CBMA 360]MUL60328.1 hypothetical protein [Mycolicibacterium sp. CBMA 335]MUL71460.1 hypothetical protein [Mycolicibacterium sp. CBMA 311]MUL73115.1 hypothetical protein [Mycolicibacterium sp. CBMA 311]MUL95910.1 hypothetical protein [Mycolicibacterium sp. CBMA 230]